MYKKLFSITLIGVLMLIGISAALAQDGVITIDTPETGKIVGIGDGRLNAFDQAAPVAVYYNTDGCTQTLDATGQLVTPADCTRLEILAIDPITGNGSLALEANSNDIVNYFDKGETAITDKGVTLNMRADGQFWVVTAPDSEGKVYTFSWFDEGRTLPANTTSEAAVTATPAPSVQ